MSADAAIEWRAGWEVLDDAAAWEDWEAARVRAVTTHVFHRASVLRAWYDTVARAERHEPVLVRWRSPAGEVHLAAVVARYRGRRSVRHVLEPAGQDLFADHAPLVTMPGEIDWDAFWAAVRRAATRGTDAALFRFVPRGMSGSRFAKPPGDESPVLALEGASSFDALLDRCSANHRGDIRRRLRRAGERGGAALVVFDREEQAAAEFDERFWPLYRRVSAAHGWTLADRPGVRAWCERAVRGGVAEHWAHFSALQVGGVSVAWHLGLADSRRLYWWLPVYDPAHRELGPGKLLLALLIRRLVDERWRALHFQTGCQPYKLAWRPSCPPLATVRWHAPTARGRLLAAYDRLARAGVPR